MMRRSICALLAAMMFFGSVSSVYADTPGLTTDGPHVNVNWDSGWTPASLNLESPGLSTVWACNRPDCSGASNLLLAQRVKFCYWSGTCPNAPGVNATTSYWKASLDIDIDGGDNFINNGYWVYYDQTGAYNPVLIINSLSRPVHLLSMDSEGRTQSYVIPTGVQDGCPQWLLDWYASHGATPAGCILSSSFSSKYFAEWTMETINGDTVIDTWNLTNRFCLGRTKVVNQQAVKQWCIYPDGGIVSVLPGDQFAQDMGPGTVNVAGGLFVNGRPVLVN